MRPAFRLLVLDHLEVARRFLHGGFPAVRTFKRPAVQVTQRIGTEFTDGERFAAFSAYELVVFVHKHSPI